MGSSLEGSPVGFGFAEGGLKGGELGVLMAQMLGVSGR
jgi:hypothetical protein